MADIQLATKLDLDNKVDNTRVLTDVPVNAKFTDTVYTHPTTDGNKHVPVTGTTNNGKVLKAGATAGSLIWADDNDTIYTHPSSHPASMITGLATVATSGSYNDLSNKPSIPTMPTLLSQLTNDTNFIDEVYDNTASGLTATTIKGAIDELKALFDTINA